MALLSDVCWLSRSVNKHPQIPPFSAGLLPSWDVLSGLDGDLGSRCYNECHVAWHDDAAARRRLEKSNDLLL